MRRSRPLRVAPLRRYGVPKYPAHEEPDPTRSPVRVPYPFGRKFVAGVAAAGLAALLSPAAAEDPPGTAAGAKKPRNPFTLAESGFPFRTSPYGTGEPSRIAEESARRLINRIFEEAGFRLKPDYRYERGGVGFVAGGYDPDHKVGYFFGTYENLGPGLIEHWNREDVKQSDDPKTLSRAEAEALERRAATDKEFVAVINGFDGRFEYMPGPRNEVEQKEWETAWSLPDPAKRQEAVRVLEERAAREALERLEQGVREYIAWARTQGAQ